MQWPSRKAFWISVSNYGFGGSNSHAILERSPDVAVVEPQPAQNQQASNLFIISAKSSDSLQRNISALREHVDQIVVNNEREYLTSLSDNLRNRRARFRHMYAVAATSLQDLTEKLGLVLPLGRTGNMSPLVFVFTGQGAQWAKMGHSLMQEDSYNNTILEADRCLRDLGASWSLVGQLYLRYDVSKTC